MYLKCILIHYEDEGILTGSILKTPFKGGESLIDNVALVGRKCGLKE